MVTCVFNKKKEEKRRYTDGIVEEFCLSCQRGELSVSYRREKVLRNDENQYETRSFSVLRTRTLRVFSR